MPQSTLTHMEENPHSQLLRPTKETRVGSVSLPQAKKSHPLLITNIRSNHGAPPSQANCIKY